MGVPGTLTDVGEDNEVVEEHFRAAYARLYPTIAKYAWGLTRDEDAAHEIAQETFARLFDRWAKIEDPGAYAYRVATNLIRATWRRRRDDRLRLEALGQVHLREVGFADPNAAVDVRHLVDGLPRRYRELVLLHYWSDLSLPEVALSLNRPLGTVKRQISEARHLLATALEGAR